MGLKLTVQRLEVRVGALAGYEAQLHQLARRIVDEHQKRACCAALLEPAVIAVVDLDQLTVALAPKPGLVQLSPLLTR